MSQPEENWPQTNMDHDEEHDYELVCHVALHTPVKPSLSVIGVNPHRFSKWEKLRNAQGYVLKFLHSVTKHKTLLKINTVFNMSTVAGAELVIISICQEEAFGDEFQLLREGKAISKNSRIYKDSPYWDEGLLRVRGRIDAMKYATWDTRRPIILPRLHRVTSLITDFYHRKFHHHHNEIIINEMRQRYRVQGLRALVRATSKNCQLCRNRKARPSVPEMGNIPAERLAAYERPFTNTGVDFFGPIDIVVGRRREKRWAWFLLV